MVEKLTFKGNWYLPHEPENKSSGILTLEQGDSIILEFDTYSLVL